MRRPSEPGPGEARRDRVPSTTTWVAAVAAIAVSLSSVGGPLHAVLVSGASWTPWRTPSGVHPPEAADRDLAPLRALLPAGTHVGWVVPETARRFITREEEAQRYFSAQYALAPAVVRPIYLPECSARGGWACGMAQVDALLVDPRATGAAPLAAEMGFALASEAGGVALLVRRPR